MDNPFIWILIALIIFIVSREIVLWYWRINDIIKNQEAQLNTMDELIDSVNRQNKLMSELLKETKSKKQNNESTPQ